MNNPITHYRRSDSSPWMAIPRMSRRCFWRWFQLGAWAAVQRTDGQVELRA